MTTEVGFPSPNGCCDRGDQAARRRQGIGVLGDPGPGLTAGERQLASTIQRVRSDIIMRVRQQLHDPEVAKKRTLECQAIP